MPTVAPARPSRGVSVIEDAEQSAGRGREDRQARVDQGDGQGRRPEDRERDRRRVAPRPARQPGDRQPEPDDRAEDEEEAQVGARRQPAAADDQRLRRDRWRAPRRSPPTSPSKPTPSAHGRRARSAIASAAAPNVTTTKTIRLMSGSIGWASAPWLERCGVVALSSKPGRPSERRRDRQDRHGAAERGDEAGRQDVLELGRRAAQARPDEERAGQQEHEADADAQDVAAVEDRQDRQRRQREPGGGGERRAQPRGAQAVAGVADDRRGGRQERLGRPADERAAGPHAVTARRDPQEVAGQDRGHQAGGQAEWRGRADRRGAARRPSSPPDRGSPCAHSGRTRPRRLRR